MSSAEIIGLLGTGVVGGAINAVAGGGTLVTFPTLLAFGTLPVVANATNTVALVIGTSGSVYGYRQHFAAVQKWLRTFLPVSLAGGVLGGLLLTRTSNQTFSRLVPFLILFATLVFVAQGAFRRFSRQDHHLSPSRSVLVAVAFQFLVALYGGYFGAGIGILMLASLGFIGLSDIHEMNTLKTLLGLLINLVAGAWFVVAGLVDWPRAGVMCAGALAGYYLGSHYSQKIPQSTVRRIVALIGFALSIATFYKEFAP